MPLVNSICATCDDITGVRFEIEGDAADVNVLEACDISHCNYCAGGNGQ